ncbi:hypothetical protein C3L33_08582, partial [Rhododendron williamsianum]
MVQFLRRVEGEVVKIKGVVFASVFNTLSNALMSRDFMGLGEEESLGGGVEGLVRGIMEVASAPNLSDFYPVLGRLDLQGLRKRSEDLVARFFAMWETVIEERRRERAGSSASSHQDFLDSLLDDAFSNDQINQFCLPDFIQRNERTAVERVKIPVLVDLEAAVESECLANDKTQTFDHLRILANGTILGESNIKIDEHELFTAGTDTSTTIVEWAMAELVKNPESMGKVRQELATEVDQSFPKESHLPQLPYLQACVREALRLHPPAPFLLPHRALASCEVMNYTIPVDAQVLVNVWALGRDPTFWEDPLQFKPERFLDSTLDYKGNDYGFLPFGAGRRICPGIPMAAKVVPLVLASLVHFFDWSLPGEIDPNGLDMSEKFAVTLQKEQPLLLIPKVRK